MNDSRNVTFVIFQLSCSLSTSSIRIPGLLSLNIFQTLLFCSRISQSHSLVTKRYRAEQSRAEQSRAEQSRAEQSRAEQSRAEQSRAEQSRAEQSRAEQSRAEQSRAEQSRAEQGNKYGIYSANFKVRALFCFLKHSSIQSMS